jgi:hypothetical protein
VGEKFLRQGNYVTLGRVLRLQQPPAQPSLYGVKRVAGGGLLRLKKQDGLKFI